MDFYVHKPANLNSSIAASSESKQSEDRAPSVEQMDVHNETPEQAPAAPSKDPQATQASEGSSNFIYEFLVQVKILMKKNYILYRRRKRSTAMQLLVPVLFAILLRVLASVVSSEDTMLHPRPAPISIIPPCTPFVTPTCKTLSWATNSSLIIPPVTSIVNIIAADNFIPQSQLEQHNSEEALNTYFSTNLNQSVAGVVFFEIPNINGSVRYSYSLYMNVTSPMGNLLPVYQTAIDKAILKYQAQSIGGGASVSVPVVDLSLRGYPLLPPLLSGQVVVFASYGSSFFYTAIFFQFIVILGNVVAEKESNLRLGMGMMGLYDGAFWFSWFLTMLIVNAIASVLLVCAGLAMQLDFFLNTHFIVNFTLFFVFGLSMTPFAFWVSTFISTTKSASTAGFIILTIGFLIQSLMGNSWLVYLWYDPSITPIPRKVFAYYPPLQFAKIFADIARLAMPRYNAVTNKYDAGPGFGIEDLYRFPPRDGDLLTETARAAVPVPAVALLNMVIDFFIFYGLTIYCDTVFGGSGVRQPLYFFLTPSYWGLKWRKHTKAHKAPKPRDDDDSDVAAEAQRAHATDPDNAAILIMNMVKEFNNGIFDSRSSKKRAVDGTCLVIENNSCITLLGHNGAGKSTTLNMLVGLYPPTSGNAYVFGYSILNDMPAIRRMMGVCPQHDILWNELTAYEHMSIFCEFKGVPADKRAAEIKSRLEDVSLWEVAHKLAGTYSGGMKRRLSVAISCAGSPKIIYLDEPTTGMDPASRRKVWGLIHQMKQGRVIVLTTHSMEEAEALSDRIGIMAKGRFRCLGDSLHLKNRYGRGYNINVVCPMDKAEEVKQMVLDKLDGCATIVADNAGNMMYNLPADKTDLLQPFIAHIEAIDQSIVRDFGVSQTTLEEVFLKITKDSEFATFADYGPNSSVSAAASGASPAPFVPKKFVYATSLH